MTLGLVGGLVGGVAGAAAGAVGAAAGVAAGAVGAAAEVAAGVVTTIANVADAVCIELANFAIAEYCKLVGISIKVLGVLSGTITSGPEGKAYHLKLKGESVVKGVVTVQIYEIVVTVDWEGNRKLSSCDCLGNY